MFLLKRGFTLIELLVVIAIIGILASIILVSLSSAKTRANDTRVISDIRQIDVAILSQATVGGPYLGASAAPVCLSLNYNKLNTTGSGPCVSLYNDAHGLGSTIAIKTWPASGTTNTAYASFSVYATLPSGAVFCMDSTGKNGSTAPGNWTSGSAGGICP